MMGFVDMHRDWLSSHVRRRSGERKSRLQRGHGHGERLFLERVWWPLFGNFDDLHPEYEVVDWRGHPYFIDFAWIRGQFRFAFEVKGYGPHVQNTDRVRYRRELNREMFLQTLGYRVVSIPYDDLEESPHITAFLLKSLLAPYMIVSSESEYSRMEREVLLVAVRLGMTIRPADLVRELGINKRTALKYLKILCSKGRLRPVHAGESSRVVRYEYVRSMDHYTYW